MILINRTEEVPCVVFHADGASYRRSILAAEDRIRVGLLDTIPPRVIAEMRNFFHFDEDLYFSFVANGPVESCLQDIFLYINFRSWFC
jgi:hypothetical protein